MSVIYYFIPIIIVIFFIVMLIFIVFVFLFFSGYSFDDTESDIITTDREIRQNKTHQLERVNSLLMEKMETHNHHFSLLSPLASQTRNFNE